jgi:hypothetical protein
MGFIVVRFYISRRPRSTGIPTRLSLLVGRERIPIALRQWHSVLTRRVGVCFPVFMQVKSRLAVRFTRSGL